MERSYELMLIITPDTTEDERAEILDKLNVTLDKMDASEVEIEDMGNRRLAYVVDKKENGFYVLVTFEAQGESLQKLEQTLNIEERILKYIILKG
ncbi:MAG: 30S ribosomal protein S6 [Fusobacteriota bacterium]